MSVEIKTSSTMTIQGRETEIDAFFGDYKEVDGLILPHSMEIKNSTAPQANTTMTFEQIELNVDNIGEELFQMPEARKKEEKTENP